jgi:hypothetical protein
VEHKNLNAMFIQKFIIHCEQKNVDNLVYELESLHLPVNQLSWRIKTICSTWSSIEIFSPELNNGLYSSVLSSLLVNGLFRINHDF